MAAEMIGDPAPPRRENVQMEFTEYLAAKIKSKKQTRKLNLRTT